MDSDIFPQLIAIVFCLIASALFSATETALTTFSPGKVHQMVDAGKKSALLNLWLKSPNQVLTAILIGNNIVNILASSLATGISYDYMHSLGFGSRDSLAIGFAVGIMTLVILIFGEEIGRAHV